MMILLHDSHARIMFFPRHLAAFAKSLSVSAPTSLHKQLIRLPSFMSISDLNQVFPHCHPDMFGKQSNYTISMEIIRADGNKQNDCPQDFSRRQRIGSPISNPMPRDAADYSLKGISIYSPGRRQDSPYSHSHSLLTSVS